MKSMIGNEEAMLVVALIKKGQKVPEDLKAKALEQLRVFSMSCEAGSARGYLLDKLIEGIEDNDIDKITGVMEMSAMVINDLSDKDDDSFTHPETMQAAKSAIDAFIEDMRKKDIPNGAIVSMVKKVINLFGFIPFMYQDEILLGFSGKHDCVLAFGIGFEGNPSELMEKTMKINGRVDALRLIAEEFEIEEEIDIHFCTIWYKLLDNNDLELIIRGLG